MTGAVLDGLDDLQAELQQLGDTVGGRIAAKAVRRGQSVIRKAIAAEAPRGSTGSLRRSIGSRFRKRRKRGELSAIVGINVGKRVKPLATRTGKTRAANSAPHGHLAALGTQERSTRSGAKRGRMPANNFVGRGFRRSAGSAAAVVRQTLRDGIREAVN